MARDNAWSALFSTAFHGSRNAMVLVDDKRRHVEAHGAYLRLVGRTADALIGRPISDLVVGGPLATHTEWVAAMDGRRFNGEAELRRSDGSHVAVQWAATAEIVTGRRLVLFVVLSTSRWGRAFRRDEELPRAHKPLTGREREVVQLIASGHTGPEIAEELHIAHDTVRKHASNAMTKTGARSRAHLVAKALAEGIALP
jgi:PAS domain S-box-containing protein